MLSTTILTSPAGAQPAPSVGQAASSAKNQPPLPPGPARIKTAQGLEDDDLGPGVIILSIAAGVGVLVWLMFKDDDDDATTPTTGT